MYLSLYRREEWDPRLEEKYQLLKKREENTYDVISRLAEKLNLFDKENYIIFKSVKPYPATPNDTDVIWLGSKKKYKEANEFLLNNGYSFHEWAPQQKTYFDERGKDSIGKGKKGGTYYIDFYEEISTDYYSYTNRNALRQFMVRKSINGIDVNLLAQEPELAIIMLHNVFPERTFQLEHFFVPLYYLADRDFDLKKFISFVKNQKMEEAVKANMTIIKELYDQHFGSFPEIISDLINVFGVNEYEREKYLSNKRAIPHMFSQRTFWKTFIRKTTDLYSFKSLLYQAFKMFNPVFFIDVVKSIRKRASEKGVYHLE